REHAAAPAGAGAAVAVVPHLRDGRPGAAAADDGGGAILRGLRQRLGNGQGALGIVRHLEYAHRTVPDDCFCAFQDLLVLLDGFRTDVEAHLAVRDVAFNYAVLDVVAELFRDDVVDRQLDPAAGALVDVLRNVELVVF